MMLGYNNYPSRTHHLHNHFSPTRNRQQLDDNNSNLTHDYSGSSSFHPTTPTSQQQTFDDNALRAAAASAIGINGQSLNQVPDLMPSESWMVHGQHTATAAQRFGHQRESSLSSLGSNGPASPYNPNLSNPQIAVTDSGSDGYHELNSGDGAYSYRPSKSMADNFYTSALANYSSRNRHRNSANNGHTAILDMGFHDGLPNLSPSSPAQQKLRSDRGLAPAPELSASGGSSTASHSVSVASSAADDDSPHTPSLQEPEDHVRRRKNGEISSFSIQRYLDDVVDDLCSLPFTDDAGLLNPPPKLDRTLTDIYTDELYNPNFTFTSASPPQTVAMSPTNDIFAQRLQAANSHHLSAAQSPESGISRERSPFRQGSPYASTVNDFSQIGMNQVRLGSAQQMREKRKAEQDSREIQQQFARNAARQQGTPNTISPKDAVLDFNDTDDASNFPLFPPQEASAFNNLNSMNNNHDNGAGPQQQSNQPFRSMGSATPVQSAFDFSMPANIQMPRQYPFIPRPQQEHHQQPATPSNSNFSRVSSPGASTPDYGDGSVQKPSGTKADGGTYTCTYHGCTLRFETPALLQKHKREGHRQANALNALRDSPVGGMTSGLLNSQAGPHKCERINPSTGKPCNTIFSRPYDLTRHEDTIHNARKQKVRCDLCTEEKTFSRADALTRHYRVCHPDVEFPGKHRRRGGGIS
ncbi:hypothetical protein DL763_007532 [Monosporascus cannonballus]|nr:hypothetical protein DL763_007532 [Monosporascus cannonballus]